MDILNFAIESFNDGNTEEVENFFGSIETLPY